MTKARITVLEGLFPEQVRCVISENCPENFELLPAEIDGTFPMIPRRRREYRHGRCCARLALAGLGYPDCPVPLGTDRAPLWPEGVVGSISHCGDSAAAAVAHRVEVGGIGLDIEQTEELDQPLVSMICRSEELERLGPGDVRLLVAKLLFSAKESVFKCIFPLVQRFVDFQEVEVQLDLDANTFVARPHAEDLEPQLFRRLHGRFGQTRGLFVTAAYLG